MNKRSLYYGFILMFLWALHHPIRSEIVYRLTVEELLERGLQNSISLQSSQLQQQIAENKISLAKNKNIPDIQISGLFGYVGKPLIFDKDLSYLKSSNTPNWKQNYQINVTQPIYQGGRIKNNIEKANLEYLISELQTVKNQSELKLLLIAKYLNLYTYYQQKYIYDLHIKEATKRLHDIEVMKEQGIITLNDVLRSKIVLSDYQLSAQEISNNIIIASQQLSIAMGLNEDFIYEPDSAFLDLPLNLKDFDQYLLMSYQNYPDMRISDVNIDLGLNNLKLVKADYLPSLSLSVGNTFQRPIPNISPSQDLYINSWGVTLNLSYRISALFDKNKSLSMARNKVYINSLAKDQQKQKIRSELMEAYLNHQQSLSRIKSLKSTIDQANENYRIVSTKYFNHLAILTDLLDANSIQLTTQLQMTTAKVNAVYTYYQLLNLSGTL